MATDDRLREQFVMRHDLQRYALLFAPEIYDLAICLATICKDRRFKLSEYQKLERTKSGHEILSF